MALELPQSRVGVRKIQTQKRNIPLEQIIAVEGQSPVAAGIETLGNVLGQSLQRRAELQRQGQQLAQLEKLAGQTPGAYAGVDPSIATSLATKQIEMKNKLAEQQAQNYNQQQLLALNSGQPDQLSTAFPLGVPKEAATLAATIGSRDENRALREQQFKQSVADRRSKEKTDIVTKFNADLGVKKVLSSVDAANNVRELATSGNPIAANAIPTYMARASSEVGNLSEADKRPFGGSQAIFQRLQAALKQQATGQMTEDNRRFVISLADTMEKSATNNLDRRAKELSGQYGEASDFLKPDKIYKMLRPPELKELPPAGTVELGGGFSYKVKSK